MNQNIKTLKFNYNDSNIINIKLVGKDIIIYFNPTELNETKIIDTLNELNVNLVPRVYLLHVSCSTKDEYDSVFGGDENVILTILQEDSKFIAKVEVSNEESYLKYLEKNSDTFRIKPYIKRLELKSYTSKFPSKGKGKGKKGGKY